MVSNLYDIPDISGELNSLPILEGTINGLSNLSAIEGVINTNLNIKRYNGLYDIKPKARQDQVLNTADKLMVDDLTIREIPIQKVSDPEDLGYIVYIG